MSSTRRTSVTCASDVLEGSQEGSPATTDEIMRTAEASKEAVQVLWSHIEGVDQTSTTSPARTARAWEAATGTLT